jgi:hypothetical protein
MPQNLLALKAMFAYQKITTIFAVEYFTSSVICTDTERRMTKAFIHMLTSTHSEMLNMNSTFTMLIA